MTGDLWFEVTPGHRVTVSDSGGSRTLDAGDRFQAAREVCEDGLREGWLTESGPPAPPDWRPVRALVPNVVDGVTYETGAIFDMSPEEIAARVPSGQVEVVE